MKQQSPHHPESIAARSYAEKTVSPPDIFGDIGRLADVVARVYTLERRLWESRTRGRPSSYLPADIRASKSRTFEEEPRTPPWNTIASFLASKRIGPIDYIARQFDQYAMLTRPLYANELCGQQGWGRYTTSKESKPGELTTKLTLFRKSLHTAALEDSVVTWSDDRPVRDCTAERLLAALYENDSFSPLFVFCAATDLVKSYPAYADDAKGLLSQFELQAAVEYVRFRADYDRAWGTLIPRGFQEKAKGLYRGLLHQLF